MRRILAILALIAVFIALNHNAYDGFFQDDELDNLSWAPLLPVGVYAKALVSPLFEAGNFRPVGHGFFAVMGHLAGLNYPTWVTPVFVLHLLNAALLYALLRRLRIEPWHALIGTAFFTLSASAMDAYWKPMYIFDLLSATLCLACILLWMRGQWLWSLLCLWLAYKAKEPAVMLPLVLAAYEYWFGEKRWGKLAPFFLVSLSFGLQGLFLNPNHDNDYTFRFTLDALTKTVPFYAGRVLLFPWSGALFLPLLFLRDRRAWFGLFAILCFLFPLLFLPGRIFEAYLYLPLALAVIAISTAASQWKPRWFAIALCLWMPWNVIQLRAEQKAKLAADDEAAAFFESVEKWSRANPSVQNFAYDSMPAGYHSWGMAAAWNIAHHTVNLPVADQRAQLPPGPAACGSMQRGAFTIRLCQP